MSGPLHILKHEHRVIEKSLRALIGTCARLTWGEHVPADVLTRLVEFINGYADGFHHRKEETYLFPALQRHGIQRHGGALALIVQEHKNEREVTDEMRRAIKGYREVDADARQRFVEAAHRYVDLLLPHIEHEDSILFRIADELLDAEEITFLSEAFKQAAAELGADKVEAYEKVAGELEETWGI